MQMCYHHPKLQGIAHCKQCRLPICYHCMEGDYCPECVMRRQFVQGPRAIPGAAPRPKPRLVETPTPRSLTMDLMIRRLQAQAFDADAASRHPKKRSMKRSKAIKTPVGLSYGAFMPGIAPLVKVSRSPISRLAAVAIMAFGLGVYFASPQRSYAETAPEARATHATSTAAPVAPVVRERVTYRPVYIYVRGQQAPSQVAARSMPMPARTVASHQAMRYAPAIAQPVSASSMSLTPRVAIAFPTAGSVLRQPSTIQLQLEAPEQLTEVGLAVDGAIVQAIPAQGSRALSLDPAAFTNGTHTLQVVASDRGGAVIRSEEIAVAILH